MRAQLQCPHCRKLHQVLPQAGGRVVTCSGCKKPFRLPDQQSLAALAQQAAPAPTETPPAAPVTLSQAHTPAPVPETPPVVQSAEPDLLASGSEFDDLMAGYSIDSEQSRPMPRREEEANPYVPLRTPPGPSPRKKSDGDPVMDRLGHAFMAFMLCPGLVLGPVVLWATIGVPTQLLYLSCFGVAYWPVAFASVFDPRIGRAWTDDVPGICKTLAYTFFGIGVFFAAIFLMGIFASSE